MKVPQRAMKKWIAALRSGKYKQGIGWLERNNHYCCLGVACDVLIPQELKKTYDLELVGSMPCSQKYAPEWLKKINRDVFDITGFDLVLLNDGRLANFNEIADLLESLYVENP
jgi:hypothetical protein